MNEKDIYKLIGNSFDDRIKLDFDDVKKRIADLPSKETDVITPVVPSSGRKKPVFTIVAAAAACLVCIVGLSFILSQSKNESASYAADSYILTAESAMFSEPAYSSDFSEGAYGAYDDFEAEISDEACEDAALESADELYDDYDLYYQDSITADECISCTDISASDAD